jgi:ketosteroid isomerase-like protein
MSSAKDARESPQENLDVVRALYAAAARRDSAAVFSLYDPDVELDASRITLAGLIGQPIRHGHEGVRTYFHDLHEAFEDLDYDVEQLIPSGEYVISSITRRGAGKISGIQMEMSFWVVFMLRAGRVARVTWFPSRREALEAAGLPVD